MLVDQVLVDQVLEDPVLVDQEGAEATLRSKYYRFYHTVSVLDLMENQRIRPRMSHRTASDESVP